MQLIQCLLCELDLWSFCHLGLPSPNRRNHKLTLVFKGLTILSYKLSHSLSLQGFIFLCVYVLSSDDWKNCLDLTSFVPCLCIFDFLLYSRGLSMRDLKEDDNSHNWVEDSNRLLSLEVEEYLHDRNLNGGS